MVGMAFSIEAVYRFFTNRVIKSLIREIEVEIEDIEDEVMEKKT